MMVIFISEEKSIGLMISNAHYPNGKLPSTMNLMTYAFPVFSP